MNHFKNFPTFEPENETDSFLRMKQLLSQNLYSIEPTIKKLTKTHLSILSVPGVAKVCLTVKNKIDQINDCSIRGRSVAIISRGKMFGGYGRYFLPIMDWLVVQAKIFANVDCYPFVIRNEAPLKKVLEDISNSYCGVIFLDDQHIPEISPSPLNFFVLSHWKITKQVNCQFTNFQHSSYILAHLIEKKLSDIVSKQLSTEIISLGKCKLPEKNINQQFIDDTTIGNKCPIQVHQNLKGKIGLEIKYKDIEYLRKYFTEKNLKRLILEKDYKNCTTAKLNTIITDGTAILGFGNIGPVSGLPVMQTKSMMFKLLGDVNIVPLCINPRQNPTDQVNAILDLVHLYNGINLEDIKAPQCFSIERKLQSMDILPVFHDDQHGTAIAALAGFINALKITEKSVSQCKVVINGAGAAGLSIASILNKYGVNNIIICDSTGIIYKGREANMNPYKTQVAQFTNLSLQKGQLKDAIVGADVFIGVSVQNTFDKDWIKLMNFKPIIFAMSNPNPQISRQQAEKGGCFIYGNGKSSQSNQITNSLAYPGIFRAVNEHNIRKITDKMKIEAAQQIASIKGNDATKQSILPYSLNKNISIRISQKLKQFS